VSPWFAHPPDGLVGNGKISGVRTGTLQFHLEGNGAPKATGRDAMRWFENGAANLPDNAADWRIEYYP
jgi:hypothetical protein